MPADITEAVKGLLEGQNKSELSREVNVSRETLYRWERGESFPNIQELKRLADATKSELTLTFNATTPRGDLEQQVSDLRELVAIVFAGRMELLSILELMTDDPVVKKAIAKMKRSTLGFEDRDI